MKNTGGKKPIFELEFSTNLLNEIKRKKSSVKSIFREELIVIDRNEHLTSKEKMSRILNIRRREESWHIKMLVSLGLFNNYVTHCEYLMYVCENLNLFDTKDKRMVKLKENLVSNLSSSLERLKKYDLKYIENLIFRVDNSFSHKITEEDDELFSIDILALNLLISAEGVDFFDKIYRDRQKKRITY